MSKYLGYGIDLSKLYLNKLEPFIKKHDYELYENMREDLGDDKPKLIDEDILEYLYNYENEHGYYGLSAYLSDFINEQEGLELRCDDCVAGGYIYVPQSYPWNQNQNMKNLTPEKLTAIFKKYLSEITEKEIVCTDLVMYVDDFD